jgi:hypothetical protein
VALCLISKSTTSKDFPLNKRWFTTNQENYGLKDAEYKVKYGFKTTFTEHGLASAAYERYLKEEDGGLPEHIRAIQTTNKVSQPGIDDPNFRRACGFDPKDVINSKDNSCTQCNPSRMFRTPDELRQHNTEQHPPSEKLTCHYEEFFLERNDPRELQSL